MQYKTILDATFLSRPNRFIAKVLLEGKQETVHVKNTVAAKNCCCQGRMSGWKCRITLPARRNMIW